MSSLMQLLATKINDKDCLVFLKTDFTGLKLISPNMNRNLNVFLMILSLHLLLLKCDHTHDSRLHIAELKGLKRCCYGKGGRERMIDFMIIIYFPRLGSSSPSF